MLKALDLAECAERIGEVPVGCIVVLDGNIIGSGYNRPISFKDPTAHAEILALKSAAKNLSNYRIPGTTLYVTLEPCTMCIGAMIHARIQRLVFGANEPRAGAACSAFQLLDSDSYNHKIDVVSGVLAEECGEILRSFFSYRR